MQKPMAVRKSQPSLLDIVFAGGSTAVFLMIITSLIGAISLYLR